LSKRLTSKALLVIVLDASDFEASIPIELLDKQLAKKNSYVVVLNKIDTLPDTIKDHRLKNWAVENLKKYHPFFQDIVSAVNKIAYNHRRQKM
jgi:ribosome biogenesis GTPase A